MIENADNAYRLQRKAQKTAEEAINHLHEYMTEHEKLVFKLNFIQKKNIFFLFIET